MKQELKKRLITSIFLVGIIYLSLLFYFILSLFLFALFLLSFIEFKNLIRRFKITENIKFIFIFGCFLYLIIFFISLWFFINSQHLIYKFYIIFIIIICIATDMGGYIFGKIFKGRKLTKLSPNKTYSGVLGSYVFTILSSIIFMQLFSTNIFNLILISIYISTISQLGDIFVSYLKRLAEIKDSGKVLPGHGGVLDRIDGFLFSYPLSFPIFLSVNIF